MHVWYNSAYSQCSSTDQAWERHHYKRGIWYQRHRPWQRDGRSCHVGAGTVIVVLLFPRYVSKQTLRTIEILSQLNLFWPIYKTDVNFVLQKIVFSCRAYLLTYSVHWRPLGNIALYKGRSKSSRPSSDQNKIKIVFASYSAKAQNTTCTMWLLGCKYFVHFSLWTKCLSDGVENANIRTVHKFLKNLWNDTNVSLQKFISQLVIQDETCIHHFNFESEQQSMQWNERNRSKLSFHYTA